MPGLKNKIIIHNSYNYPEPEKTVLAKLKVPISDDYFKVALVSNLIPYKGIYEFLEAAKICIEKDLKICFIFAGADVHKNSLLSKLALQVVGRAGNNSSILKKRAINYGIEKQIFFLGYVEDVQLIYKNIHLLCFPSHIGGVGRPVFEAAYYKVPSIVAIEEPVGDTIIDGVTGLCIKPKDVQALADAIEYLYNNKKKRNEMGEKAYRFALKNFNSKENALKMFDVYKQILSTHVD